MRNFWEIYALGNGTLGLSAGFYMFFPELSIFFYT